jgi:hypothetical protein
MYVMVQRTAEPNRPNNTNMPPSSIIRNLSFLQIPKKEDEFKIQTS